MIRLEEIQSALDGTGLVVRGGFHPSPDEAATLPAMPDGGVSRTVVLIGNVGGGLWAASGAEIDRAEASDALDAWTAGLVRPLADRLGAHAVFPFEQPYQPFQQWAQRCEAVFSSPLGILIHPDYGLWHAYRAALLVSGRLALPRRGDRRSPCEDCADRPCLTACPVDAFTAQGYAVGRCTGHVTGGDGATCRNGGCLARNACPVGREHRYPAAQQRFHTAAFLRSNA